MTPVHYSVGRVVQEQRIMRFVLTYEGLLSPSFGNKEKHGIRRQFHPQLKRQWEVEPVLVDWMSPLDTPHIIQGYEPPAIPQVMRGSFTFIPLVTKRMCLVCSLDIVFLRPE